MLLFTWYWVAKSKSMGRATYVACQVNAPLPWKVVRIPRPHSCVISVGKQRGMLQLSNTCVVHTHSSLQAVCRRETTCMWYLATDASPMPLKVFAGQSLCGVMRSWECSLTCVSTSFTLRFQEYLISIWGHAAWFLLVNPDLWSQCPTPEGNMAEAIQHLGRNRLSSPAHSTQIFKQSGIKGWL